MSFPYKNPISSIQVNGTQSVPRNNTYGTTFSVNNTGGYMEVYSLSDLYYTIPSGTTGSIEYSGNTIPIEFTKGTGNVWSPDVLTLASDNISSGRRRLGMLVYVYEEDQVYQYYINNYETLFNTATASTGCVRISDFGTTINNKTAAGQLFINAWTGNTIEDVSGATYSTAVWRKFSSGASSGGTSGTSLYIVGAGVNSTVRCGVNNTAKGDYGASLGGSGNTASGNYSFVGGGGGNTTSGTYSIIGGGTSNTSSGNYSFVGGGGSNTSSNYFSTIGGGGFHTSSGFYSTVGGGRCNTSSNYNTTVSGGYCNTSSSKYSTVGGGFKNNSTGLNSTVGGGVGNTASGNYSTVGGGSANIVSGNTSSVVGGYCNTTSGSYSFVGGGTLNTSSAYYSFIGGGAQNTISGNTSFGPSFSTILNGCLNTISGTSKIGSYSVIIGGCNNSVSDSFIGVFGSNIVASCPNTFYTNDFCSCGSIYSSTLSSGQAVCSSTNGLLTNYTPVSPVIIQGSCTTSSIRCGVSNNATASFSASLAGTGNTASGLASVVVGGAINNSCSAYSFVGGGVGNRSCGNLSSVVGGNLNTACCSSSFIGGGLQNLVSGSTSSVVGGFCNIAGGNCSFIGGGFCNISNGSFSAIGGGAQNTASNTYSTVSGGRFNIASNSYSTVGGGICNNISGSGTFSTVGGGFKNTVSGRYSFIGGGSGNTVTSSGSTIGGGFCNTASGSYSFIGGGQCNIVTGTTSAIAGGFCNRAQGIYSFVGAGTGNTVTGAYSSAFGCGLNATASCTLYANNIITGGFSATTISASTISTPFTTGSVIFQGSGGTLSESNSNFFWDNTNGRLGIKRTPAVEIDVTGSIRASSTVFTDVAQFNFLQTSGSNLLIRGSGGTSYATMFQTTGNFVLQNGGAFTDAGYRLDVNGTSRFQNHLFQSSGFALISLGNNLNLRSNIQGGSGYVIDVQSYNTLNSTNNEQGFANFLGTYAPTSASGTPSFNALKVTPTINQTGGASGVTRGLYVNPTLTSAADFRAIEVERGKVILNSISGNTLIGTTADTGTYKLDVRGLTRFSAATGTSLTVISSGNSTSAPVFSVQGSQGELFSVTDSLTGSLFSVSDISGLPILEVFSDSTTIIGDYQAPSLYTTKRVSSITASTGTTIYSFPTSAYTSSFVDYFVSGSTGLRAGNMMAIWSGSTVNFTETSTNDIGVTTPVTFGYVMSGSSAVLRASASTGTWIVESILRGL
jgi:hypothetical protein